MSIVLSWTKKDTDAVLQGYEIYRSTSKATVFDAANKLASSTDKSLVTYTDNAAVSDVPYWYGVRSLTIYGNVDSTPVLLVDPTVVGTGAALPFIGDFDDGLIESYPNEQSFSAAAMKILLEQMQKTFTTGTMDQTLTPVNSAGAAAYQVNKFWKNGKPWFAPNHPQGGITGNVTVQDINTKLVAPLLAAKPRVEIEGILYEFGVMSKAEAMKYVVGGHTRGQSSTDMHYDDRVVPKSFGWTGPNGVGARVAVRDGGDGVIGFHIETNGVITNFVPSGVISSWPVGIAWYFTPVIG
jgi:hypothetical protein